MRSFFIFRASNFSLANIRERTNHEVVQVRKGACDRYERSESPA